MILVGMPGCGKTHYCLTALPDHVRLCQDEGPHRFERLFARYLELLDAGAERIVIDRTNPTAARRAQFADPARQRGYRVKIVHFDLPQQLCRQRISDRIGHPTLDAGRMDQAINRYFSVLNPPAPEECNELVVIGPGQASGQTPGG